MYCGAAIQEKLHTLRSIIQPYRSALVAFSGGVDSTLLLTVTKQVLGSAVTAVTVRHMAHSEEEMLAAVEIAHGLGVRHHILDVTTVSRRIFETNPIDRCYHCKRLIFEMLLAEAREHDMQTVLDGSHAGDLEQDRPGLRALKELGISMPLQEAGLNKADIRLISRHLGLSTHDKPARPCLATRFLPGETIDQQKLGMIQKAESYLAGLGLYDCRVRFRNGEARIETTREGMDLLLNLEVVDAVNDVFSKLGFSGILLDFHCYPSRE